MKKTILIFMCLHACMSITQIDDDDDDFINYNDNCPFVKNTDQLDFNQNGIGDFCEDSDYDQIIDQNDNCKSVGNKDQQEIQGCTEIDDLGMIFVMIEGGSFLMGSDEPDWFYADAKPVHHVDIGDFHMSKTEITVGQYRKCVQAGGCSEPDDGGYCNWTDSVGEKENHPINCVDWHQARSFAQWIGGDLPSEAQWEYAARSRGKNISYPWGNETADLCKRVVMYGCGYESTREVCSTIKGNSTQGLCDLSGNVAEWILEKYSFYNSDSFQNSNVTRGGSWHFNDKWYIPSRVRRQTINDSYSMMGFRVVKIFR